MSIRNLAILCGVGILSAAPSGESAAAVIDDYSTAPLFVQLDGSSPGPYSLVQEDVPGAITGQRTVAVEVNETGSDWYAGLGLETSASLVSGNAATVWSFTYPWFDRADLSQDGSLDAFGVELEIPGEGSEPVGIARISLITSEFGTDTLTRDLFPAAGTNMLFRFDDFRFPEVISNWNGSITLEIESGPNGGEFRLTRFSTLLAIPEPASMTLGFAALAVLIGLVRWSRKFS
jgi:hypothetical protein